MAVIKQRTGDEDLLDVRGAAALVGRHPETVRRWVWSGRLPARKQGNRLFMARADVEAAAGESVVIGLAVWADRAHRAQAGGANEVSAADLVIEDRAYRSQPVAARARR